MVKRKRHGEEKETVKRKRHGEEKETWWRGREVEDAGQMGKSYLKKMKTSEGLPILFSSENK